jgi:aspartate 1-decarboxylase
MQRSLLKSKIHRATVTQADLEYEGSISIDQDLMKVGDLITHEHVHVWNVTQGTRFETYVIPAPKGSKMIQINGAAAHLAKKGDKVIITSFTTLSSLKAKRHKPKIVFVDDNNDVTRTTRESGMGKYKT